MWSLYAGSLYMQVQINGKYTLWTCKMRSLWTGGLYIQVVFRAGLTVIANDRFSKSSHDNVSTLLGTESPMFI